VIHADVELRNAANPELRSFNARALVDTGMAHLCIPQHVALQLGLKSVDERQVVISDGTTQVVNYVGPIAVRFGNREAYVGALVLGKEVVLGLIPLTDLDLVVEPREGRVRVNPQAPNIPVSGQIPPVLGVTH
jgi:clan AA aspartic protease